MKYQLYCSTGAMLGRINGWDHRILLAAGGDVEADGFEFMMEPLYYDTWEQIGRDLAASGFSFPVMHTDKEIGVYLAGGPEEREKGLSLFETNCKLAVMLGAVRLVLHLWSGQVSDRYFDNNLAALSRLYDIAARYELRLMVENVPCAVGSPLAHFAAIAAAYPGASFVYDLRFGAFHEENPAMLASSFMKTGAIAHVHVSDYVGPPHAFSSLRPILHLGDGIIGLASLLPALSACYAGKSLTLESPAFLPDGCDTKAINADLDYIRRFLS